MTDRSDFLRWWQASYPESPPVNYLFKHRLAPRWARIHSLPGAKRYAATAAEWAILLNRQQTVMADLLGGLTQAKMIVNSYTAGNPLPALKAAVHLGAFSDAADPESDTRVHAHLVTVSMDGTSLNPLLIEIADDRLRAFFIAENCLISPYDGGMDVILASPAACQAFKVKYADWLSERPDGL